jgi:hypothetical protein
VVGNNFLILTLFGGGRVARTFIWWRCFNSAVRPVERQYPA